MGVGRQTANYSDDTGDGLLERADVLDLEIGVT